MVVDHSLWWHWPCLLMDRDCKIRSRPSRSPTILQRLEEGWRRVAWQFSSEFGASLIEKRIIQKSEGIGGEVWNGAKSEQSLTGRWGKRHQGMKSYLNCVYCPDANAHQCTYTERNATEARKKRYNVQARKLGELGGWEKTWWKGFRSTMSNFVSEARRSKMAPAAAPDPVPPM